MAKGKRAGLRKQVGVWEWNSTILWSKIVQTDADSCWQWLGSRGPQTNLFGGRKADQAQMTQARRILFMDVTGNNADDHQIKHTCGNPYCMNWQHFEVKPNQRKYRLDGTDRTIPEPEKEKPQAELKARLVPVQANERWWNI